MLGSMIKELRKEKKLSQKKLADICHLSTSYIQQIELGQKKKPSLDVLIKIATALEISVSELIFADEGKILSMEDVTAMATPESKKMADEIQEEYSKLQNDIIVRDLAEKSKQQSELFNSLLTIIKYYYDTVDTITDVSQTDYNKQKLMYLNLNGKDIEYTREDIKGFLDFIALSFPNFKIITDKLKNKDTK